VTCTMELRRSMLASRSTSCKARGRSNENALSTRARGASCAAGGVTRHSRICSWTSFTSSANVCQISRRACRMVRLSVERGRLAPRPAADQGHSGHGRPTVSERCRSSVRSRRDHAQPGPVARTNCKPLIPTAPLSRMFKPAPLRTAIMSSSST